MFQGKAIYVRELSKKNIWGLGQSKVHSFRNFGRNAGKKGTTQPKCLDLFIGGI